MKAIVQDQYGAPELLALREIDDPAVGDNEVLVNVRAASVNALDWHATRGIPYLVRAVEGIPRPRTRVRGVDLAGVVERVGKDVTRFRPGDKVLGGAKGAFAERAVTTVDRLARKPAHASFEAAACLHVAGLTALQGLRDRARVKQGDEVLINGAGGGVGSLAVQIAKWLGARVTAVTGAKAVDVVRALGADHVIDHGKEDFTTIARRFDVVFDIGGNRTFAECRRVLAPRGALVVVGGPPGRWVAPGTRALQATLMSPFASHRLVAFVSKDDEADLALLADLLGQGKLTPAIGRTYPLREAPAAIRDVGEGRARGKLVIAIA